MEEDVAGVWTLLGFRLACVSIFYGLFDKIVDEVFRLSVRYHKFVPDAKVEKESCRKERYNIL